MGQLYVYDPWPEAVDTLGLCGPLVPTSAKYRFARNGAMEISITHPIDPAGKWARLKSGNLIKAYVPMRTTPLVSGTTGYLSGVVRKRIKSGTSREDRALLTQIDIGGEIAPIRLAVLNEGDIVIFTGSSDVWAEIVCNVGRGRIKNSALEDYDAPYITPTRAGIEQVLPSTAVRPQLFRIAKCVDADQGVEVLARHVSYDFLGALTVWAAQNDATMMAAAGNALYSAWMGEISKHVGTGIFTDGNTTADTAGWEYVSIIEALIAPSNSVASYWGATVLRDNWHFTVLQNPYYDAGYRIDYGKNLKGVSVETDDTDIVSAFIPLAQTSKGKTLTIPSGLYTVDGITTEVTLGVVRSANDNYPIPHVAPLDLKSSIKATGTTSTALTAAYTKMIRATRKEFASKKCDLPGAKLSVDFLQLGKTDEYKQYRNIDKLFPLDGITVRNPLRSIDASVDIIGCEWDIINETYVSVEAGTPRLNYAKSRLAGWQVPGLEGLRARVDTISELV